MFYKVKFIKKNGDERILLGTKDLENIKKEFHPKGSNRKQNEEVEVIFDLENNEWRSYRKDSVVSIETFESLQELKK
jgi:hypothetical protein